MLQHALRICTIASVAIAVDADLMLAVNVKDFRYIANKFLSKDLAEKLTDIVSKVSLTRTQDVRLRANNEESGKENELKNDGSPNQRSNMNVNPIKRFLTIKHSNKDLLDRENNLPGPEYVRDELDDILNNKKEYTHDKPSVFDYTTTLANVNDNIDSKEVKSNVRRECKDQSNTRKKIDYTETKLGEWKYSYGELKKPIEIKNVKKGNLDRYTNDQGGTYYEEDRKYQFPNEKNVQYIYETRLVPGVKNKHISDISNNHKDGLIYLGLTHKQKKKEKARIYDTQVDKEDTVDSYISGTKQKDSPKTHKQPIEPELNEMYNKQPMRYLNEFSTTKDDRQIFKEPILGNKYEIFHENIPAKQDERKFQDIKESKKIKIDKLFQDSVEFKEFREQDTSSRHNLESRIKIQQIHPSIHLVGVNDTDIKYELGTSLNNNNDRGTQNKLVQEREDKIRDREIHNSDYENKYEGGEFNNEDLLLKHKKRYLNFKGSQNSEKNRERDQTKGFAARDHHYSGEDKSETVKSKLKDSLKQSKVVENQSLEGNVKFKKEKYKGKKKLRKKPIEENDMYEKIALGSNIERSRETKNKQPNEASQSDSRVELGSKAHKWKFSLQSNEGKGSQESDGKYDLAYKNTRNRKPQKPIEENEIYKKIALGSENTKNKRITEQPFREHDRHDQNLKQEPPIKNKPQKSIENYMFEKYELRHEINEDKRNLKQKENRDSLKTKKKLNRYQGYEDDRTGNNLETLTQNDKHDKHTEITKKNKEYKEDAYVTEYMRYADNPRPDFEEVKAESIKANTESLIDGRVKVNEETTKKFTMKGTFTPKRDFYKLSSPDYYKDLPRVVDKYDFEEPLPERDRERDKADTLKREPATINRKFKLSLSEDR